MRIEPEFLEKNPRRLRTRSLPNHQFPKPKRCYYHFHCGHCLHGSYCRYSHERQKYMPKPAPQPQTLLLFKEKLPA